MQTRQVGVNFPEFPSLIVAIIIYICALGAILYTATNSELADIKYTKDKNAYMDIYVMDIDNLPTPVAPKKAEVEEKNLDVKESKPDEKEKIKTTNKTVTPEPEPKKQAEEKKLEEKVKEKVELAPPIIQPKDENKTALTPPKEPEKVVKKTEEKKDDSLNDLFASIDQSVIKKDQDAVQSRQKSDKETTGVKKENTSTQNANIKGDTASGKSQRTGVYNAFIGEVDSVLTNVWSTYRALPNQDATVEITIDANGRLSYNIVELSLNTEFNQKFRDFLSRVERMQFPKPPDGRVYVHRYKMKDLIAG